MRAVEYPQESNLIDVWTRNLGFTPSLNQALSFSSILFFINVMSLRVKKFFKSTNFSVLILLRLPDLMPYSLEWPNHFFLRAGHKKVVWLRETMECHLCQNPKILKELSFIQLFTNNFIVFYK